MKSREKKEKKKLRAYYQPFSSLKIVTEVKVFFITRQGKEIKKNKKEQIVELAAEGANCPDLKNIYLLLDAFSYFKSNLKSILVDSSSFIICYHSGANSSTELFKKVLFL